MTAEHIAVEVTVSYGDESHHDVVTVPIDVNQPWMNVGAGVVEVAAAARRALFDVVDRDRQALADAEKSRGGAGVPAPGAVDAAARTPAGSGTPPRATAGGSW